jgi:DNA polymerase-4
LRKNQLKGRRITLKIKYSDFSLITRARSLPEGIDSAPVMAAVAKAMLEGTDISGKGIRLLGISVSAFKESAPRKPDGQMTLFPET